MVTRIATWTALGLNLLGLAVLGLMAIGANIHF